MRGDFFFVQSIFVEIFSTSVTIYEQGADIMADGKL